MHTYVGSQCASTANAPRSRACSTRHPWCKPTPRSSCRYADPPPRHAKSAVRLTPVHVGASHSRCPRWAASSCTCARPSPRWLLARARAPPSAGLLPTGSRSGTFSVPFIARRKGASKLASLAHPRGCPSLDHCPSKGAMRTVSTTGQSSKTAARYTPRPNPLPLITQRPDPNPDSSCAS